VSRVDPGQSLEPSLLDRLIDPDSGGTAWRHGYGIEQMVEVVRRDLEDLLNTRQSAADLPEAFREVQRSIIGYGLPDLTALEAITPEQRQQIGRVLEAVVSRFEPRLKDVRATLIDPSAGLERTIRFHLEARLCLTPAPEVAFETLLELGTGRYSVRHSDA
jgi:type VI secretion system protein ImpF